MSVSIATRGKFTPPGQAKKLEDGGSAPYAYGGGVIPGTLPKEKRLKVDVRLLEVNRIDNEQVFEISPIKVIL